MKTKALLFFSCIVLFLFSCNYFNVADKGHPEYFDRVIKTADAKLRIDFKEGSAYLDSAYSAFPKTSKRDLFMKYQLLSDVLSLTYHNLPAAINYADSAINILDNDTKLYGKDLKEIYIKKANTLVDQNNFDNAFKYFYLAKEIIDKENNPGLASGLINSSLANVLFRQKNFSESLSYYKKAFTDYSKVKQENREKSFVNIQQTLNNIALCYERLGNLTQAISAYDQALAFTKVYLSNYPNKAEYIKMAQGIIHGNLGSTYFKQGNYAEAEKNYLNSLRLNIQDEQDAIFTQIKLAYLYLQTNRNQAASALIDKVELSLKGKPYLEARLRWLELAFKFNDQTGHPKQSRNYFTSYHNLKDSLDLIQNRNSNKDFNKEFIKLAQAKEIEVLKKENELKSVYLLLAITLSVLSALSIFLILRNVRINKQHIKKLTVLNAKISGHNEMMQKTLEALEQSQEENTHMMQVVAHDMRTPIAGVIGLTSLMLEEDDLNEEQREILSMINTSGADTLNFINDLLQVQYNKSNLIKEPVEMHTLLKYCITLLDSKAKEKQQQLKIITFPIEINISREKIWRVMSNLISNAIKFSPHGTTINIEMEEKPLSVLVKVKDNGIGIPPELADRLFNMDADVQREGTDGEKSFGLGLAISKQIIEAHNGSIWFESLPGFGTTFFVELPITEN